MLQRNKTVVSYINQKIVLFHQINKILFKRSQNVKNLRFFGEKNWNFEHEN
jgi:hypothetical protein